MAEERERGFKVEDRRRFSSGGAEPAEKAESEEPLQSPGEKKSDERVEDRKAGQQELPEIDFSTFVISLSTQALMHLGEIPNPLTGKSESDVQLAKQMIDIIGILRAKTEGNLDQGERRLMDDLLYDLRMKYVEAVKQR